MARGGGRGRAAAALAALAAALAALAAAGGALAQAAPPGCGGLGRKACRKSSECKLVRRRGCQAALNVCEALQAKKRRRRKCQAVASARCACARRRGKCGKCLPVPAPAPAPTSADEEEFKAWMTKFDKNYTSPDTMSQEDAFKVWLENKKRVDKHNEENLIPEFKYRHSLQMNSFADMTAEEFYASLMHSGVRASLGTDWKTARSSDDPIFVQRKEPPTPKVKCPGDGVHKICDWSSLLPPAEDQGECSSCYAFATVGAAEGALGILTGKPVSLSKMQVMTTPWNTTGPSSFANCQPGGIPGACCDNGEDAQGCGGPPPNGVNQDQTAPCPTMSTLEGLRTDPKAGSPDGIPVLGESNKAWPHQQCNAGNFSPVLSWLYLSGRNSNHGLCATKDFKYGPDGAGFPHWKTMPYFPRTNPGPGNGDGCGCKSLVKFTKPPIEFTDISGGGQGGPRAYKLGLVSEELLMKVVDAQPVAVGISCDAVRSLPSYRRGIIGVEADANRENVKFKLGAGHGVVLVGYGTCDTPETTPECYGGSAYPGAPIPAVHKGQKYWKLKNSWGEHWGDSGYFYFVRGATDYFGQYGPCGMLGALSPPIAPDLDGVVPL